MKLYDQNHYEDALPLFEQLTTVYPKDMVLQERLGMCLAAHAISLTDPDARRQTRLKARQAFLRAKELGDNSNLLQTALSQLPEDGSETPYSNKKEVDDAMRAAETAFGRGDLAGAIAGYTEVLRLDPQNYQAAAFSGDACFKQKNYDASYSWFAKAVAIDPDQELAYRYWGDALYAAGKNGEARQKFIAAIVASPYERLSWIGLTQWAQRNGVTLSQPKIESPNSMVANGNQTNITIDASTLGKKDGTEGWMLYEITRASWKNTEFQKAFPNEKQYRHSLTEESAALGLVADSASDNLSSRKIKTKDLNPQIGTLVKLKSEGLLESYILLAHPDDGLVQDYAAYRKDHRDKLLRYMDEYVVPQAK
jgi:tetratricopeptide (TPR) repeat protein